MQTMEVLDDARPRLDHAKTRVEDARQLLALAIHDRDRLIVDLVDAGMQQAVVARLAGVGPQRVTQLLCKDQPLPPGARLVD